MNRFLNKVILSVLSLVLVVYGVDYLIQEGIKTSSYREIKKWNEVIEGGIDADILIVGSSRALVHFDPRIIEEKTGMTCYNLGLDGSKYGVQKKVLELYLEKNQKPKILIWSLDFHTFQDFEGIYRYEQFIPYWSEPKVKEILALNKGMNLSYLNIPIVRFFNNPRIKYRGLLAWASIKYWEPMLEKGYRITSKKWIGDLDEIFQEKREIKMEFDFEQFEDFKKLNQNLMDRYVKVHWVISPYFKTAIEAITNRKKISSYLNQESLSIGVSFQDLSYSEISLSQDNFYNGGHMNQNGVIHFLDKISLSKDY